MNSKLPPLTVQVDQVNIPVSSPSLPEHLEEAATNSRRSQRIATKPAVVYNYDDVNSELVSVPIPQLVIVSEPVCVPLSVPVQTPQVVDVILNVSPPIGSGGDTPVQVQTPNFSKKDP